MTSPKQETYYVLDPKLCEPHEWAVEKLEWLGGSVEDVAADAALFWAKGDARDEIQDTADLDGQVREVIAATREDGSDARTYQVQIRVEFSTTTYVHDAVDVSKPRKKTRAAR